MRVFLIIIAVIGLLGATGIGGVLANRNLGDASDIEKVQKEAGSALVAAALGGQDSKSVSDLPGKWRQGAIAAGVTALFSLILLVLVFVKKGVGLFTILAVVGSAATVLLNPSYETGANGPASSRSIAIVVGACAVVGALCAFGAEKVRQRRAARA